MTLEYEAVILRKIVHVYLQLYSGGIYSIALLVRKFGRAPCIIKNITSDHLMMKRPELFFSL